MAFLQSTASLQYQQVLPFKKCSVSEEYSDFSVGRIKGIRNDVANDVDFLSEKTPFQSKGKKRFSN